MADCRKCKRIDVKCCPTCKRSGRNCGVWHKCGEDCVGYEARIVTNADRIRNMTDEELADVLETDCYKLMKMERGCIHRPNNGITCKDCYITWLQKEVE